MGYGEARKRATYNYREKNLKRISLDVKTDLYEAVKENADSKGLSVTGYVKEAIKEKLEKEKAQEE